MSEEKNENIIVADEMRIPYKWSAGIAGNKFFQELRDNKRIMGTKCSKCSRVLVPPRIFCEECFTDDMEWVEVKHTGILRTFATSYFSKEGKRLKDPWMVGIIKLDDADGGLVHFISETNPDELQMDMKMEAVFAEERKGGILDIKYFRPLKS